MSSTTWAALSLAVELGAVSADHLVKTSDCGHRRAGQIGYGRRLAALHALRAG